MATGSPNTTTVGRLYKPNAALWLINPVTTPGAYFQQQPNALIIRDLQIQFKIEKNLGKEPNKAEIVITNAAPATRAQAEKKPQIVQLEVGYDGAYEQLFIGDLRKGYSTRDSQEYHTHLLMGDGDRAFVNGEISQTFGPGANVGQVLTQITNSLGLKLPPAIASAAQLSQQYAGGYTAHGPSEQEMDNVLKPLGWSWSVQDGQLQIIQSDGVASNTADVISQDTGMIGSPEFGDPTKPGQPPILKVAVVCRPRLKCGGTISVQSESVNGLFRVDKLTHTGDTRGKTWKTEIHARPL